MSDKKGKDESIRLQVFLSHSGVASRREAASIIQEGRVDVNGEQVLEPGFRVGPKDKVSLDGDLLGITKNHVYLVLNKPEGVICTNKDPENRPTAVSLVQASFSQRLYTVGRLDLMSRGLILLTSDGEFAERVMHPRYQTEKEYIVETQQEIPRHILDQWTGGIRVKGQHYRLKRYTLLSGRKVRLVLSEGKNREIREVFAEFKITIRRLTRTRIASIKAAELPLGGYRKLSSQEIETLLAPGHQPARPKRKPH